MASNSRAGLKFLVVLLVLGVGVAGAVFFMRPTAAVSKVVRGTAENLVPGSVAVEAEFTTELKSEIGGRVVRTELEDGKAVKAGAILAQIDPGDLDLDIERTESEYRAVRDRIAVGSQIEIELETARADLENAERLFKLGNLAEADLAKQRRVVKQTEQRLDLEKVTNKQLLESYENSLKTKKRQRDKMTIVAQYDGVISKVYARAGDLIGANTPLALIIASKRTVEAKISEENFSGIRIGQKASVRFLGYGGQLYSSRVSKILPTADPTTQRYIVHLDVEINPELLVPGITGEVSIIVGARERALVIPRRAMIGNTVLVVEDGRVRQREVQHGFVSLNAVEILKGLQEGELVISEQLDQFRSGARVRTKEASLN